jgi:iron transport multicopper oxidase
MWTTVCASESTCLLAKIADLSSRIHDHNTWGLVNISRYVIVHYLVSLSRYHVPAPAALVKGQIPPASIATLINGRGRYQGGPPVPLSVIKVRRGRRYRFRLIAMSCDPDFIFSIDNHWMTVIEADGQSTHPHPVDSLRIYSGQRYSVVVHANQPVDNYWIRALPNRGLTGFAGGVNTAIFHYKGAAHTDPTTDPTTVPTSVSPLKETDLHALHSALPPGLPFAGGADVVLYLPYYVDRTAFEFKINGATFTPPTVPVLLQILSGAKTAESLLPAGSVYSLPSNKVIEIIIPGTGLDQGGPVSTREAVSFRVVADDVFIASFPSTWCTSTSLRYVRLTDVS